MDRVIIGILSLAVVYFAIDKFLLEGSQSIPDSGSRSIAVLPFEDISPDGDQAYLGSGIADELRLELQRLDGLRVAGRTSSNAYAEEDARTIGEKLNVESLLEGSVRKDGDRIRITVQLTNLSDGFTLWSRRFDRKLDKVFEMQNEIATEVAGRLGVSLGVGGINAFRGAGTRNIEAYEIYLRAPLGVRSGVSNEEQISLLENAVKLDPNYGAAWSKMALKVLNRLWEADASNTPRILEHAHELALRGAQLQPQSATTQTALGYINIFRLDWTAAEEHSARALELQPDRPTATTYAMMLMRSGRIGEAEKNFNLAVTLEPMNGRPHGQIWHVYLTQGRFAEAEEVAGWQSEIEVIRNNLDIAFNKEDPDVLKAAIRALPETDLSHVHLYSKLLSVMDSPEESLTVLREAYEDKETFWPRKLQDIAMAAAYLGDPELALEAKSEEIRANPSRIASLWYPVMSEVRQLPAFKEFVTEINLVEYWRTYGWADACRPLGDTDFACT